MPKPIASPAAQPVESQFVKKQVYQPPYRDTSRTSQVVKSALILIAQIWRFLPYLAHVFVNSANSKIHALANLVNLDYRYSVHTKWHQNQQNAWDGLKEAQRSIAWLRWRTRDEEVHEGEIRSPGILRIFTKALWFSPAKQNEAAIQDKPVRPASVAEEKDNNEDGAIVA